MNCWEVIIKLPFLQERSILVGLYLTNRSKLLSTKFELNTCQQNDNSSWAEGSIDTLLIYEGIFDLETNWHPVLKDLKT
jgi:hypothetical protein